MKRVIALGFFDGVHRGHGALLRKTVEVAGALGAVSAALTFDVHPDTVVLGRPTPLLTPLPQRAALMRTLYGVEEVFALPFDRAMMERPWREFVREELLSARSACHLVVGENYRFGHRGQGTAEGLSALCREWNVGCSVVPSVRMGGEVVSSTRIRGLVAGGALEEAGALLGHPYALAGTVAHGKGLGHKLGFPTVNLTWDPDVLLPAFGVYAARLCLPDGSRHKAVTNIGVRPTVDDGEAVTVESFLLDFQGDLYGQTLSLELLCRLRGERRFESLEALTREVARNAAQTEEYFTHLPAWAGGETGGNTP